MSHGHHHHHDDGHRRGPAGRAARQPAASPLRVSAALRLAYVGVAIAALWGAVAWALA